VAALDTAPLRPAGGPDTEPVLSCREVEVAYEGVQVLFGVDLEVGRDEMVALLGTNGAGKSTLLKAVSGLVDPIGGQIVFEGRDITHAGAVATSRMGIVHVPGGRAVFPTLTVEEHFDVGSWLFGREEAGELRMRTEQVLDRFSRLRQRWRQLAGDLSGGEQQQLALAMAFVAKPRLLVIDELSLGLAPMIVEELLELVATIHAEGCPVLIVEQSVNVALTLASRAYFMEKGEVRFSGPTADLLDRHDILRSVFLEGALGHPSPPVPQVKAGGAGAERGAGRAEGPAVLQVSGLTKRFGGITAVDDVTFDLRQGEILGLIGPNGAGKTTIFDLLSGHLSPDGGRIVLEGRDVTGWPPHRRSAMGLGRSFQDARIFPSLTVAENIAIGLERHVEVRDHLSAVLALPAMQDSEADVAFTVEELIELLSLQSYRDKFVAELSTGSRRIVDLAMAIGHAPSVLILDEPSSGVAQREAEALGPLLVHLRQETGCSMLVIEHDMPLITSISDEILALDLGRVVVRGRADEVTADPRVLATYLGQGGAATRRFATATSDDDVATGPGDEPGAKRPDPC
jgi:ABC-type branched-subunit amino acid transport system ATPase component